MTEIAKQLHWIHNVYEELGFKLSPLPLCIDNQGAMFLASNPAQEGRTKHIHIPEHYIHEAVELEEIKLYYVPTNLQFAISSQRTLENKNSKREETLSNVEDSKCRKMNIEEECQESWYFLFRLSNPDTRF